jgi:hypothetical protein
MVTYIFQSDCTRIQTPERNPVESQRYEKLTVN